MRGVTQPRIRSLLTVADTVLFTGYGTGTKGLADMDSGVVVVTAYGISVAGLTGTECELGAFTVYSIVGSIAGSSVLRLGKASTSIVVRSSGKSSAPTAAFMGTLTCGK